MQQVLDGVTIADFTQLMQGGWAAQKLGDLGADVVKIERPEVGEAERHVAYEGEYLDGHTAGFLAKNRNKRSVALNLKSDAGKEAALDVVESADVVMENFRPGVMDRLGLGYEDVTAVNEDVIYVSGSAYGSSGPYVDRPGQDLLYQAMTGLTSYTGRDGDPPTPAGTVVVDEHSATLIAYYTLAALFHREMTGEGQKVEANLLNSAIDFQCQEITQSLNFDRDLERPETTLGHSMFAPPYGIYEASDGYVAIGMSPLEVVTDALDVEGIGGYETTAEQFEHRDEIHRAIESATRAIPADELVDRLAEADVQAVRVKSHTEMAEDPQVQHNEMLVELDHPDGGTFVTTGSPVEMEKTPEDVARRRPPNVGEHTAEVLEEIGYDDEDVQAVLDANE